MTLNLYTEDRNRNWLARVVDPLTWAAVVTFYFMTVNCTDGNHHACTGFVAHKNYGHDRPCQCVCHQR